MVVPRLLEERCVITGAGSVQRCSGSEACCSGSVPGSSGGSGSVAFCITNS